MLEVLSALAGILSIVITIILEWDRLGARFRSIGERVPAGRPGLLAEGIKSLLSIFFGGVIPLFIVSFLTVASGLPSGSPLAGLLLLAALIGGVALGVFYLRRGSWGRLLLFVIGGAVLFVALAMIFRPA